MAESLYLGKTFDPATKALGDRFLLDQDDLATHGIVIGMTGSGKTGLSVGMIEELLRAKVPVIVIDPKGDMGNLALAFDQLSPAQFLPWVDADAAAREGQTREQAATAAAEAWSKGLADWGLVASGRGGLRSEPYDARVHPGLDRRLAAQPDRLACVRRSGDFEANEEELRDEIDSIVTALLGFVKITADPREQPRIHPPLPADRDRLAEPPGPRPRIAHRAGRQPADREGRRAAARCLLPAEGPQHADVLAQQPGCLAAV